MVSAIENYADISGRVIATRADDRIAGFLAIDVDVASVDAVAMPAGGGFYPNWFADRAGSVVTATVAPDSPHVVELVPGAAVRCRIRGAPSGVAFILPDSIVVEDTAEPERAPD